MTGLEFYRIKKDLSRNELAEQVGCVTATVALYEKLVQEGKGRSSLWLTFSNALGVPVSELMRTDLPELVDRKNGWLNRPSRTANPDNPIAVYRAAKHLTYGEISEIIGCTTREAGRLACAKTTPSKKHIVALARYEKMSPEEFIRKYRRKEE